MRVCFQSGGIRTADHATCRPRIERGDAQGQRKAGLEAELVDRAFAALGGGLGRPPAGKTLLFGNRVVETLGGRFDVEALNDVDRMV